MNDILERLLEQEERLRFPFFNEESAWELGCLFVERARRDDLAIAVDIATKDRVLFHHSRAGASPDNEAWIRRKKRTVNRFGHSSFYIGKKLESLGLTLAQKYYLPERLYAAHGGCFPLIVDGVGRYRHRYRVGPSAGGRPCAGRRCLERLSGRRKGQRMSLNPVIALLGRRLRLAVIGGGEGSFIGPMHRLAARFDDRYELVTGVMSSKPEKALAYGRDMGFAPDRLYATVAELIAGERARADGVDVVSIMTPNDSHFPYAMAALEAGFDVICDKPMTNTLEEAETLHRAVLKAKLVFCLTHNYTGYPMVRQAKAMVEAGMLGELRLLQVEYVQGGRAGDGSSGGSAGGASGASPNGAPIDFTKPRMWKYDPARSGPSLVMGDIGTHAHNLLRFVTGLEVAELAAERGASVPGRAWTIMPGRSCAWITARAAVSGLARRPPAWRTACACG
jgi:predicted dehydrogenase/uncharacterized protein (UPF0303 family)